ncbi:MAG: alanine--glyoxylate aminotransferase family protein [Armatimonadetes bacterium]|nr:alanine--glyoxylate aminotransferase family protein [Armatimonadota bacterium]
MKEKQLLMIPGPTPVPPSVLKSMAAPMINHRGTEYAGLQREILRKLKLVFQTDNEVIIFPASGTGGLESVVTNLLSPGDRVLSLTIGVFGDRFARIAETFGAEVERMAFEWGQPADAGMLEERLSRPDADRIKAVLVTHNETSTGVVNDMEAIAGAVRSHSALLLVDAISGLIAMDLPVDRLGLDAVVAGSQKAFMIPPGLTFAALSPRALEASKTARMPRYYWDFGMMLKSMAKDQTPYTPAVSLLYALDEALRLIEAETMPRSFARHQVLGEMTRRAMEALGMDLFAREGCRSNSVTAVRAPSGLDMKAFRKLLRERYNVVLGGGQQKLESEIFRIGHLGFSGPFDIIGTVAAIEMALAEMGVPAALGQGVQAAQKELMKVGASL